MNILRLLFPCVITAVMGALAVPGWSQVVNTALPGTATDASGAAVPNARVSITQTQTGVAHTAQTNNSGNYSVPYLSLGPYAVAVEANGSRIVLQSKKGS